MSDKSSKKKKPSTSISFRNIVRSQDIKDVKAALQNWVNVVKMGDTDDIVSLYTDNATFWGTVASNLSTDKKGIKSYFVSFLQKENLDVKVTDGHVHLSKDTDEAIYAGNYTFTYTENGVEKMIPARFTFVFKKQDDGEWLIKHHHSSAMPQWQNLKINKKIM